jgi:hypothetical protein
MQHPHMTAVMHSVNSYLFSINTTKELASKSLTSEPKCSTSYAFS